MSAPAICALGGGHGLAASLSALRHLTSNITAIVTVADDGGSSGRLRRDYDVLPPGDLRMALAALCDTTAWGKQWAEVLQHRFDGNGDLGGHALGNLMIVALWQQLGDHVQGLDMVGRLLNAHGRVLPMACSPLAISAEVLGADPLKPLDITTVRGQVQVATTPGEVLSVSLDPESPTACPEALEAIRNAEWVILGPGSWFTSVMPHLLVPELLQALCATEAVRVLTLNVDISSGETAGFTVENHVEILSAHAPDLRLDYILADPSVVEDRERLETVASTVGARVVLAPVADAEYRGRHDVLRLAAAYRDMIVGPPSGFWGIAPQSS